MQSSDVMASVKLKNNLPTDRALKRIFDAVPILERHEVSDKTVAVAAKIVVARAKQLTPRGNEEDRRKRSASQRSKADWNYPLWKTTAYVTRKYGNAAGLAVIGTRWPKGNKAYFFTSPKGRRQVLWGRRTGRVIAQVRNWIVQAFDETKSAQISAMKNKLKELMDDIWRRSSRG